MFDLSESMLELAVLAGIAPAKLQPFRSMFAAALVPDAAASTHTIMVPNGRCAVLLNTEVDSFPKIAAAYDYSRRQPFSYADPLTFQWTKDGQLLTPVQDYHYYLGEIFFPSDQGKLVLSIGFAGLFGPAIDSQFTTIVFDGVFLPRTAERVKLLQRMALQRT